MGTSLYLDGSYLHLHPNWHVEDSEWKARNVLQILDRNALRPASFLEVGCGAGEVLAALQREMPPTCTFHGYEISADAYRMCLTRENERLTFSMRSDVGDCIHPDVVLALDVLEHTEDYFSFLRSLRRKSEYCVLHVPLDLSIQSLLWGLPQRVRKSAGHLHYFTQAILLSAVEECGYQVVDHMYTRPAIERPCKSFRARIARYPRMFLAAVSESIAALTLGGFSMLVLARRK